MENEVILLATAEICTGNSSRSCFTLLPAIKGKCMYHCFWLGSVRTALLFVIGPLLLVANGGLFLRGLYIWSSRIWALSVLSIMRVLDDYDFVTVFTAWEFSFYGRNSIIAGLMERPGMQCGNSLGIAHIVHAWHRWVQWPTWNL